MIEATESTFDDLIKTAGTALVEFSASWCGPCHLMRKTLKDFAAAQVIMVDVDRCPILSRRFAVASVPTLVLLKGGKEVRRHVGLMNLQGLQAFVS